ncbi:hypothetical protein DFH29DRAFT_215757 [Suillus ampliporus]|nr:hypothetical protein DFH29DRAFT_215757 [Suillus ampliporus]
MQRARCSRQIPGQDQDGYNTEPDFFGGMHDRPQTSGPRPQKHLGRLKRLKLAVTRTPRPAPAPAPAPPTTQSSATAPPTFQARIRHLLTSRPKNATPHIVDVPYAQGREVRSVEVYHCVSDVSYIHLQRNAAAGAPGNDEDLVPIEYFDDDPPQNPDSQQQSTAVQTNAGEHGGGRLCCCC